LATAEIFSPNNRTWSQPFPLPEPIEGFTATLLNSGKVLLTGGYLASRGSVADAWLYDAALGAWSKAHPMSEARSSAVAIRVDNGKVLVVRGIRQPPNAQPSITSTEVMSAELYDPISNSWSRTSTPPSALNGYRGSQYALPVNDGRELFLFLGPSVTATRPVAAVFYDPASDRWTTSPGMEVRADAGIDAVRLSNGKVLVLLSNQSVLFDPGGTAVAPAASGTKPAENLLDSARTTPYIALIALLFLVVLLVRYANAQLAARRRA